MPSPSKEASRVPLALNLTKVIVFVTPLFEVPATTIFPSDCTHIDSAESVAARPISVVVVPPVPKVVSRLPAAGTEADASPGIPGIIAATQVIDRTSKAKNTLGRFMPIGYTTIKIKTLICIYRALGVSFCRLPFLPIQAS